MADDVAILGAGAWGTALAVHIAGRSALSPRVILWTRRGDHADSLRRDRENARYLPGIALPESVVVTSDLAAAGKASIAIVATPVAALAAVAADLARAGSNARIAWLSKGFVALPDAPAGYGLAHQWLAPRWPRAVGVISGPSFAEEVARGLPTALVVASPDRMFAQDAAALLRGGTLRAYDSDDIAAVEVGGAIKNVLAIAAGLSDGLGFGHNARAALITRGLAESVRLSTALGGRPQTLMGLAGLGDLVLTCTGDLSRNRRVGLALAGGGKLSAILAELGHVAEGVHAARAAVALAVHHHLDMPITAAVNAVLNDDLPVRDAVVALLTREPKSEAA